MVLIRQLTCMAVAIGFLAVTVGCATVNHPRTTDTLTRHVGTSSLVATSREIALNSESLTISRITSYNVCYTKLLRLEGPLAVGGSRRHPCPGDEQQQRQGAGARAAGVHRPSPSRPSRLRKAMCES